VKGNSSTTGQHMQPEDSHSLQWRASPWLAQRGYECQTDGVTWTLLHWPGTALLQLTALWPG